MARSPRRSGSAVTIRTVAERAGVSAMTVSNVLNGKPVSAATEEAVREAVGALGYRPNTAARRLAMATSHTVGILHGHPLAEIFGEILAGLLTSASAHGIDILLEMVDLKSSDPTGDAVRRLIRRGAQGLVLPPIFAEIYVDAGHVQHFGVPVVALATGRAVEGISNFRVNEAAAVEELTRGLIDSGRKRILFVDGPDSPHVSGERKAGFLTAMAAAGQVVRSDQIIRAAFDNEASIDIFKSLLRGADCPDAIVAWNDDYAALVMLAAHLLGLKIPEDLAVTGFDDNAMSKKLWPPLTTVGQPVGEMAEQALSRLMEMMSGAANGEVETLLQYKIELRGSS